VNGPYQSERDAAAEPMPRAVRALHDDSRVRSGDPDRLVATCVMGHMADTLAAAGVELGAFDRRIVAWLCGYEPATVQVVLGLVARAHAAGREAGHAERAADGAAAQGDACACGHPDADHIEAGCVAEVLVDGGPHRTVCPCERPGGAR
jgi:hypothetical protein